MHTVFFKNLFPIRKKISFLLLLFFSWSDIAVAYQEPKSDTLSVPDQIAQLLSEKRLNLFQQDSTIAFYTERNNEPAWESGKLRTTFINDLKEAEPEGLYFEDYRGKELEKADATYSILDKVEKIRIDILLTDAFFKFGGHLVNGKVDPRQIHKWGVPKNKLELVTILKEAVEKNELKIALQTLRPPFPIYSDLRDASREYVQIIKEQGIFIDLAEGKNLEKGEENDRLPEIQKRLHLLGYLEKKDSLPTIYTKEIEKAVRKFQKEKRLQLDGIIGPETIAALNRDFDEKHSQILVNLERWRWFPRNPGNHYILINIANFSLDVIKNKDVVRSHKIVVGRQERKTVIFSDTIKYLVYNPNWYIPPTIKREAVIPAVRQNPGYLSANNMEVFDSNWQKLNPYAVDWGSSKVYSYNYKQNPGPTNPMGRVKIMYPNGYLIFSHDNPARHLFDNNVRAYSSGCIRVESTIDLSIHLLEGQVSAEEIDTILSKGDTQEINLDKTVQIHHFYWTAWRQNGETRLINDLYGYDDKTFKALNLD